MRLLQLVLAITLCAPMSAQAQEDSSDAPELFHGKNRQAWLDVDRRARTAFTAGWITGASGLGIEIIGLATANGGLILVGALGEATGAPIMAGSSLRSRRAMYSLGESVSPAAGYTSWGLWGGGFVFNIASVSATTIEDATALSLIGLGCRVGAYATAAVQQGQVGKARKRLQSGQQASTTSARLRATLAPWGNPHTRGVALTLQSVPR